MAHSSYQTLARYDDCAYRIHVRSMNDIRQREREALISYRSQARQMQQCKIRRLLIASDGNEEEEREEQADFYDGDSDAFHFGGYDEVDHHHHYPTPSSDIMSTSGWSYNDWNCQPHPDNAPSPSLSNDDSDYCSSSVRSCDSPLRKPSSSFPAQRPIRPRTRKEILSNRKRINNAHHNPELIKSEFATMKRIILENLHDREQLRLNIRSRWQVISDAVDSSDEKLSMEALLLLIGLIKDRAINITDLLFILQQGIYISLKNSLMRMGKQQLVAVQLIYHIVNTDNRSAPYMIDLMSTSQILSTLDDLICTGTDEESHLVTGLYVHLFEIAKRHMADAKFQPILPETLCGSSSTIAKMLEHYNPIKTFKRLVRAEFIQLLFNRFLKQLGFVEEPTLQLAMSLISDCLLYTCSLSNIRDASWIQPIVRVLLDSQLDQAIMKACEGQQLNSYKTFGTSELKQFLHHYCQITSTLSKQL